MSAAQPDWAAWSGRQKVRVWEALALSLGHDPRQLGLAHFYVLRSSETRYSALNDDDPAWLEQMCERLAQLQRSRQGKKPAPGLPVNDGSIFDHEVPLPEFVEWARAKRWKTPPEFKQLAPKPAAKKPAPAKSKPAKAKAAAKSSGTRRKKASA